MKFPINDGSRPSRLSLGRQLSGEIPREESVALEEFAAEVDAARADLDPFDWRVLQAAAQRVRERPLPRRIAAPVPPWRRWLMGFVPLVVCALALFSLQAPDLRYANRIKGSASLDFYVLADGEIRPGVQGESLRAGDQIQFTYRAGGLDTLVLVGVDADGASTIYYPEQGHTPTPIVPGGRQVLEGSIRLDDALGTEVYLGVFGVANVDEALDWIEDAWEDAGVKGLLTLSASDSGTDHILIRKVQ